MFNWGIYIVRFIVLLLVQGLLINNIHLGMGDYVNMSIYPLFILLLPIETPYWTLIGSAFLIGLGADLFTNTMGLNASASVLTAFVRPRVLNLLAPRDGYEFGKLPTSKHLGLQWFITYASVMLLIHHLWLFLLENFNFTNLLHVIAKAVVSSFFSILVIVLAQYITIKPKRINE